MVIRAGGEVERLVSALRGGDAVRRDAAVARLRVIGARAVDRLAAMAAGDPDAAARAAALRALEGIEDDRVIDAGRRALDDPDATVRIAAIGALRGWVVRERGTGLLEALSVMALDSAQNDAVRLAALDALADLPRDVVQPLIDQVPRAPAAHADDPLAVREWVAANERAPLSELHALIVRIHDRERTDASPERRRDWLVTRGAVHHVLARRGSRVALYDLREAFDAATAPLPLDFLTAVAAIGDASCLEPMARAWSAVPGDTWWRDRLRDAAADIRRRTRAGGRSAAVTRIRTRWPGFLIAVLACALGYAAVARAQLGDEPFDAIDHPAIAYTTAPLTDPVTRLARRIQSGDVTLAFDGQSGYLRALLDALKIPVSSQMAVFSKTSLQRGIIAPDNPRTIFFNDSVAVAWPRGGFIEIASHDPRQGVVFYAIEQRAVDKPQFIRPDLCLTCHYSYATLYVPGLLRRSVVTEADGRTAPQFGNYTEDDRSPFAERWAGWYVTGQTGAMAHLGNSAIVDAHGSATTVTASPSSRDSMDGMYDTTGYLSPYSDVVAQLVFDHQVRMINLLTRVGWEMRVAAADHQPEIDALRERLARELTDALLFVGEPAWPSKVEGTSGFAEAFSAQGPRDHQGRSLRQLDLQHRLMRYPCSYLIYSEAFDALPEEVKTAVYRRLRTILSGQDTDARYAFLTRADRQAITEILTDTKPDFAK
jgi:hypothetical protein